jgi:hypothetical protein
MLFHNQSSDGGTDDSSADTDDETTETNAGSAIREEEPTGTNGKISM